MVKVAHQFFITICAASDSGGMEVNMKLEKIINDWIVNSKLNNFFKGIDFILMREMERIMLDSLM